MAINIFKSGGIGRYYFKENSIEYGPFQFDWILQYVNADTQVKVSNSNWCPAKQHQDFRKYFNVPNTLEAEPYLTKAEPLNSKTWITLMVVIVAFLFLLGFIFISNNSNLNEVEIERQKQIAIDSLALLNSTQQNLMIQQQDSINMVTNHRIDSLKINEKKLIFLQNKNLLIEKVRNYYLDIINNEFNASNYYADKVNQYITLTNITPLEINDVFSKKQDYTNENVVFYDSTFVFQRGFEDIYYFNYSINYSCFRSKKNKTQVCDVVIEIGFDENFKIKSYKELEVTNLTFEE
jgi:hypothetical protein